MEKTLHVQILVSLLIFLPILIVNVYGHGLGSEVFPPVDLYGKQVSLEISSSQNNPDKNDEQQISISLIDFDSKITLRDVTFLIKTSRGEQFLFEKEFQSDNGSLVFNFISENIETIQVQEENKQDLFTSLLGLENRIINIRGPNLSEGGLYKFDINIITANDYSKKLDKPLIYNAGISIAQISNHEIVDPNYGIQNIKSVTYYDEINNFKYDAEHKEISFSMPFEWSVTNINQTSVIHQELKISKTFGDLLVSGFSIYVNNIKLSDDIITIDDSTEDNERIVHLIINQKELWNIYNHVSNNNGMNFLVKPNLNNTQLSTVTENAQFKILVSWKPENLKSDSKATIYFDITDIFLKNKPIAVNYDLSITQNNKTILKQHGLSTDSKEKHNTVEFTIPQYINGIVYLNFQNLGDNNLAKSSIPIIVNRISEDDVLIPEWIRNNAKWWSDGQIDDETFILGIQYLIRNDVIIIPKIQQDVSDIQEIPEWIRNNAKWWADGQIDDGSFVQGLKYLLKVGILHI